MFQILLILPWGLQYSWQKRGNRTREGWFWSKGSGHLWTRVYLGWRKFHAQPIYFFIGCLLMTKINGSYLAVLVYFLLFLNYLIIEFLWCAYLRFRFEERVRLLLCLKMGGVLEFFLHRGGGIWLAYGEVGLEGLWGRRKLCSYYNKPLCLFHFSFLLEKGKGKMNLNRTERMQIKKSTEIFYTLLYIIIYLEPWMWSKKKREKERKVAKGCQKPTSIFAVNNSSSKSSSNNNNKNVVFINFTLITL